MGKEENFFVTCARKLREKSERKEVGWKTSPAA